METVAGPRGLAPAMRVAFVTSVFPNPVQPVLGTFAEDRVRALSRTADVEVIAPVAWCPGLALPLPERWRRFAGVPARRPMAGALLEIRHPRRLVVPKWRGGLNAQIYCEVLRRELTPLHRETPFDVIDAHFLWPDGYAAVHVGQRLGIPVCVTAHGSDLTLLPDYPRIRRQIEITLRGADHVVGVSQALVDLAVGLGARPDRTSVIPNGVDTRRFRPAHRAALRDALDLPRDRPVLLGVGTLDRNKGFERLVRAMPLLRGMGVPAELVLVGEGPRRRAIEDRARRLEVHDRLRILGSVPQDDVARWMAAADALVLPSAREGWPTVLYEAWACGIPVAASAVFGIPEAIRGPEFGELLADREPPTIAAGIARLLARPRQPATLIAHARRRTWDVVADEMLDVLLRCRCHHRGTSRVARFHESDPTPGRDLETGT